MNLSTKHHVCYMDNNHNYIAASYCHSEFMSKASAKNVFESFSACLSGISESKLLQVSSDGPNLDLIEEDKNEKDLSKSKKLGKGKIGASISYDHLCSIQKDSLVLPKKNFSFLKTLLRH